MNELAVPKLDTRKLPALSKLKMGEIGYPSLYMQARKALEKCVKVDEVKEIVDKHSAIAHYAKQVKDDSLLQYAKRIKLRAYECMGALLKEMPGPERSDTAKKNHISGQILSQSIRMQDIPPRVRSKLIDQKIPASMYDLGQYGDDYSDGRDRCGFISHVEKKEQKIRHTEVNQAKNFCELLNEIKWKMYQCTRPLNPRTDSVYAYRTLGFATPQNMIAYARKDLVKIIAALVEFEFSMRDQDLNDDGLSKATLKVFQEAYQEQTERKRMKIAVDTVFPGREDENE